MTEVVLFHTHGIGSFDFSSISGDELRALDSLAAKRSALLCPTVYLKRDRMASFGRLLSAFAELKAAGELPRIIGFSLEGPVLGARGGIPKGSVWRPTEAQWHEMSGWFDLGLKYVVMAPDVLALDEEVDPGFTFSGLLALIYGAGGRVALGHFAGRSASESAMRVTEVLEYLEERYAPSPYLVLTDHLFNDMPRNFVHAFRTGKAREAREAELARILCAPWSAPALMELLGPVPGVLLEAAVKGRLTPALNFDGGHVDLAICRRVVEYLGDSRVIAMTDHTETRSLAGEPLSADSETTLLYRMDDVLAASAVDHERQLEHMTALGFCAASVQQLFFHNPLAALRFSPTRISTRMRR